jgi:Tol biopolymer transport system component
VTNERARKLRLTLTTALVALFAVAASPDAARASFPGENGRFALSWYHDTDAGVSETDLAIFGNYGFRVLAGCRYGCHLTGADWSPNGRRLVYAADWDEQEEVDIERADGSGFRMIVRSTAASFSSPVWSPTGRRIAYVFRPFSGHPDIYVIHTDRTGRHRVSDSRRLESDLDWSSRNRLIFTRTCDLFRMRPDGSRLRRLTETEECERQADWAPDGRRLTFVRGGDIWTMSARGRNASLVVSGGYSPTWSPDGTLIAFLGGDGEIHTVTPNGTDNTAIGDPVDRGSLSGLDWEPR